MSLSKQCLSTRIKLGENDQQIALKRDPIGNTLEYTELLYCIKRLFEYQSQNSTYSEKFASKKDMTAYDV